MCIQRLRLMEDLTHPATSFGSLSPQDEQKCVETVELGSYEKCQDLRAVFKRKHRFILLRSPGNKVRAILKAASLPGQDLPGKISVEKKADWAPPGSLQVPY